MSTFDVKARDFLAQGRLAVAGVSRTQQDAANIIYGRLKDGGRQVFPVNPNAETIDGAQCYPDLKSIPGGVDGVVIVTRPDVTERLVRDCAEAGVSRVWIHENAILGAARSSVSPQAVAYCQENGIEVIAGGCPLMYLEFGHKCMRWMIGLMGRLPE